MDLPEPHHIILIIYDDEKYLKTFVDSFKNKPKVITSKTPSELINSAESVSVYDFIFSGTVTPYTVNHDSSLLSAIMKVAKPDAKIIINQAVKKSASANHMISQLKLSGFIRISEPRTTELSVDQCALIQQKFNIPEPVNVIEVSCCKPAFEVGSASRLNLKPNVSKVSAVWKLEDSTDELAETIDPDNLLDEEDLKKPEGSLRVCSTTGKRKACKDCSCGLAEELQGEQEAKQVTTPRLPSSCGSCYLGDAFRCATCPYLGMPAFKPGDKVQLSTDHLQADM